MKFRARDVLVDDAPWSSTPVEADRNQIKSLIENNQHYTIRETTDILKIAKLSIENHLHQLSCVNPFDVWVPH